MTADQSRRIEKINTVILALMVQRSQVHRRGTWAEEEAIYNKIEELESQIKLIKAEA